MHKYSNINLCILRIGEQAYFYRLGWAALFCGGIDIIDFKALSLAQECV